MVVSNQLPTLDLPGAEQDAVEAPRGPRARTRRLMLEAASGLMQDGVVPSVTAVAEAAGVSRATAYRYFPSQAALVEAVVDEALGPILSWSSVDTSAERRVADLLATSLPRMQDYEATFRAALKLSLGQETAEVEEVGAPFRRGHRLELLDQAVRPLAPELDRRDRERLVRALALVFGVEALVVLRDICSAEPEEVRSVVGWAAQTLVRGAVADARAKRVQAR